ncbi:MAG: hypothetical protein AMXMBFR12_00780 [Candidatus Babeliales bacterium]
MRARISALIELLQDVSIDSNTTIIDGDNPSMPINNELAHYFQITQTPTQTLWSFWSSVWQILWRPDEVQQHNSVPSTVLVSCSRFIGLENKQKVLRDFYYKLPLDGWMIVGIPGIFYDDHPMQQTLTALGKKSHWARVAWNYYAILSNQGLDHQTVPKLINSILWKNVSYEYHQVENTYESESEFAEWIHEWLGSIVEADNVSQDFDKRAFSKEFASHYCSLEKGNIICKFTQMIIQAQKR